MFRELRIRIDSVDGVRGYLEAERCENYNGLREQAVTKDKISLVAGEGFEPSTFGL